MTPHPRQHLIDAARTARSRREAHELEARRVDWITNTPAIEAETVRARHAHPVSIGAPQATAAYSSEYLARMGVVGLYRPGDVDGEGPGCIGEGGE